MGDDYRGSVRTSLQRNRHRDAGAWCVYGKNSGVSVLPGADEECSSGSVFIPCKADTQLPVLTSGNGLQRRMRTEPWQASWVGIPLAENAFYL